MIIGLVGFIGSGKGTAGDILLKLGFNKASFAGLVKDVTAVMFGWDRVLLEGDTDESREFREMPDKFWSTKFGYSFTPRLALQKMGTEAGRNVFHDNFWIDSLEKYLDPTADYVITDVRFLNELNFVHNHGGVIIEINNGEKPFWYETAAKANDGYITSNAYMLEEIKIHESEWRWIHPKLIDGQINNNGTKEDLSDNLLMELTKFYGTSKIEELKNGVL